MIRVENVEERSAGPVGETTGRKRVAVRNRRGRGRRRRNIGEGRKGVGVSKDSEGPRTGVLDSSFTLNLNRFLILISSNRSMLNATYST